MSNSVIGWSKTLLLAITCVVATVAAAIVIAAVAIWEGIKKLDGKIS